MSSKNALAALALVMTSGCSSIPIQMHTSTTIQHADGKVEHKETHWQGTLDHLPAQLSKAGDDLADVTAKMAKELTDVPPPGKVTLKDLGPTLAKYDGDKKSDFVFQAKDEAGKPIDFAYVRLGAPSYDDFFRTAQELYALTYQADQTVHRMRELAGAIMNTKVDASAELKGQVDKALSADATASADANLVNELKLMQEMGTQLGAMVTQMASKVSKLVSTGQALITSAPSSLTNPKVATHLGLVKDGLTASVKVIKESGVLIASLSKNLSGFSQ